MKGHRNARPWVLVQFGPIAVVLGLALLATASDALGAGLAFLVILAGVAAVIRGVVLFRRGPES